MTTNIIEKVTPKHVSLLIVVLFISLSGPALPAMSAFYILGDLGGSIQTVSFGSALSLLGVLITKPFGIILAEKIGRLKLLKMCIIGNLVTTLLVSINSNYYGYLLLWFAHGLVGGPTYLLICTTIRKYASKEKILFYTKFILGSLISAPVFGAAIGSILAYQYQWRWGFFVYVFFYLICTFYVFLFFYGSEFPIEDNPIDWLGYLFYATSLLTLGFCLTTSIVIDGFRSEVFNFIFTTGLVSFLFFLIRNFTSGKPIINFQISEKNLSLFLTLSIVVVLFAFHYAIIVLLSHWLHLYVKYSLSWIGWILLVNLVGVSLIPVVFKFINPFAESIMLLASITVILYVCLDVMHFDLYINLGRIMRARLIGGIAMSVFMPAAIMRVLDSCSKKFDHWGIGLFTFSKSLGSFFGVAFFSVLWDKRSTFYYTRLGGGLTNASPSTQTVLEKLNSFSFSNLMKLEGLNEALNKRSHSLAVNDCFLLIGIALATITGVLIVYIIYERKKDLRLESK